MAAYLPKVSTRPDRVGVLLLPQLRLTLTVQAACSLAEDLIADSVQEQAQVFRSAC